MKIFSALLIDDVVRKSFGIYRKHLLALDLASNIGAKQTTRLL